MSRKRFKVVTAIVLALLVAGGAALILRQTAFKPKTITAYFTSATAIYPGDEVRVSGVKIGTIKSIVADGTQARMTLNVDRSVPIPADAKAVIVAQNLLAARYVQLAPAYVTSGPTMPDGAVIPVGRTAIPVEWDEVKAQLMRLATDLGPKSDVSGTSVSRFIESTANALDGNGDKLREALSQLSGVGRILADGSGNIVDVIKNLQTFLAALRDSNTQIVQFQDRLASLSSVMSDSDPSLEAALKDLPSALADVKRFVAGSRDQTAEQIQRLGNVTQVLVDHYKDLEQVLHVTPNALANAYNIYNPVGGGKVGAFVLPNTENFLQFVCGAVGAVENVTAPEAAKMCQQYMGPVLKLISFNTFPLPVNPFLAATPPPDRIIYSEPRLAPGGEGPTPEAPEIPTAVSAYTGLPGDPEGPPPPPPPGRIPGVAIPLPPPTDATGFGPGVPGVDPPAPPTPANVDEMLLPAEAPAP